MNDRVSRDNGVTVDNAIIMEITSGQLFDLKKTWTLDELLHYLNEKEAKKITGLIVALEKLDAKFQLDVGIMLENNKNLTTELNTLKGKIDNLRDNLYEGLPSGEIESISLIKLIKKHIKALDDLTIEKA